MPGLKGYKGDTGTAGKVLGCRCSNVDVVKSVAPLFGWISVSHEWVSSRLLSVLRFGCRLFFIFSFFFVFVFWTL